jgi:hypothetical protein
MSNTLLGPETTGMHVGVCGRVSMWICTYHRTGMLIVSGCGFQRVAGLVLVENCTVDASIKVLCFVVTIAMV